MTMPCTMVNKYYYLKD